MEPVGRPYLHLRLTLGCPFLVKDLFMNWNWFPLRKKGQKIVDGNAFMPHLGNLEREEPCSVGG